MYVSYSISYRYSVIGCSNYLIKSYICSSMCYISMSSTMLLLICEPICLRKSLSAAVWFNLVITFQLELLFKRLQSFIQLISFMLVSHANISYTFQLQEPL